MFLPRVIPCLLLKESGLIKTVQFKNPRYLGDPLNAVKIFNEKEVNEIIFLDIMASKNQIAKVSLIDFEMVSKISRECLVPLTYGGGIRSLEDIRRLFEIGVEKVVINTAAFDNPLLIDKASNLLGRQSVVISIDALRYGPNDYEVYVRCGTERTSLNPKVYAQKMEEMGAGEIFINSIDRDGTMTGYDTELISSISESVSIPVIACGGAGRLSDFATAISKGHASAVAAGSLFVFFGRNKAVLITYPERKEIEKIFQEVSSTNYNT